MKPIGFLLTLFTVLMLGTTFTIDYEQIGVVPRSITPT